MAFIKHHLIPYDPYCFLATCEMMNCYRYDYYLLSMMNINYE